MFLMPTCAARWVLGAFAITVAVGCGGDDSAAEDASVDTNCACDTLVKDTAVADQKTADSSIADTSIADTSVADASDAAPDDAGVDGAIVDAGSPDASIVCSIPNGFGYASVDGGCGNGEQYQCNADKYELLCECPAQTCTCKKNGAQVGSVAYAGCPGCKSVSFANVASGCGVPY